MSYKLNYGRGLEDTEAFLFDMDGTIYLGMDRLDGTLQLLDLLKKNGKKVIYITNNSSKNTSEYVSKLKKMDIPASEEDFFTSAQAVAYLLKKEHPGARIFTMATPGIEKFLEDEGFQLVHEYTQDPEKVPHYALLTFDIFFTYDKLRMFCDYVTDGVDYIATHPDMVCPAEGGRSIPDVGSFMLLIEGATGRKPRLIAGKPNPTMINVVSERLGIPTSKIAVIGDRLNTDIQSGINAGAKSVCVLTGETTQDMLITSATHPNYVFESVLQIYDYLKTKY